MDGINMPVILIGAIQGLIAILLAVVGYVVKNALAESKSSEKRIRNLEVSVSKLQERQAVIDLIYREIREFRKTNQAQNDKIELKIDKNQERIAELWRTFDHTLQKLLRDSPK